jgi:hypothetical protein
MTYAEIQEHQRLKEAYTTMLGPLSKDVWVITATSMDGRIQHACTCPTEEGLTKALAIYYDWGKRSGVAQVFTNIKVTQYHQKEKSHA